MAINGNNGQRLIKTFTPCPYFHKVRRVQTPDMGSISYPSETRSAPTLPGFLLPGRNALHSIKLTNTLPENPVTLQ